MTSITCFLHNSCGPTSVFLGRTIKTTYMSPSSSTTPMLHQPPPSTRSTSPSQMHCKGILLLIPTIQQLAGSSSTTASPRAMLRPSTATWTSSRAAKEATICPGPTCSAPKPPATPTMDSPLVMPTTAPVPLLICRALLAAPS